MKEIELFTKEEKERLKGRLKDLKNVYFYQFMKMKFYDEINKIDKTIKAMRCEQVCEFNDLVKKDIAQLEKYKKDLIESVGFFFECEN